MSNLSKSTCYKIIWLQPATQQMSKALESSALQDMILADASEAFLLADGDQEVLDLFRKVQGTPQPQMPFSSSIK